MSHAMETDQCTVCKSHNTVEWYPSDIDLSKLSFTYEFSPESQKTFRVVRCHNCTHVFCSPLPKNIYKNYADVVDNEYIRHAYTRGLTAKAIISILKKYAPKGKLLDVGCATGDFLAVTKMFGYVVEGLELSSWSVKIAREKGLRIHKKTLRSLSQLYSEKYDIITLWGVIEHFEHPLHEMHYLNQLIKPGGILAIWTGNVDGVMSKILGRRWWYWQGQHIQYFTSKSLNYLAQINNFSHITTKRYPIASTYEHLENSLSRYMIKPYIMSIIKPLFMIAPVWYLKFPGEMLWLARKK